MRRAHTACVCFALGFFIRCASSTMIVFHAFWFSSFLHHSHRDCLFAGMSASVGSQTMHRLRRFDPYDSSFE